MDNAPDESQNQMIQRKKTRSSFHRPNKKYWYQGVLYTTKEDKQNPFFLHPFWQIRWSSLLFDKFAENKIYQRLNEEIDKKIRRWNTQVDIIHGLIQDNRLQQINISNEPNSRLILIIIIITIEFENEKKYGHGRKRSNPFEKRSPKAQASELGGVIDEILGGDFQVIEVGINQLGWFGISFHSQILHPPHFRFRSLRLDFQVKLCTERKLVTADTRFLSISVFPAWNGVVSAVENHGAYFSAESESEFWIIRPFQFIDHEAPRGQLRWQVETLVEGVMHTNYTKKIATRLGF